jgi:hypothetical protein
MPRRCITHPLFRYTLRRPQGRHSFFNSGSARWLWCHSPHATGACWQGCPVIRDELHCGSQITWCRRRTTTPRTHLDLRDAFGSIRQLHVFGMSNGKLSVINEILTIHMSEQNVTRGARTHETMPRRVQMRLRQSPTELCCLLAATMCVKTHDGEVGRTVV